MLDGTDGGAGRTGDKTANGSPGAGTAKEAEALELLRGAGDDALGLANEPREDPRR